MHVPATYHNVADYRRQARRRLPRSVFDYVDGGAEDEVTLEANEAAFRELRLMNRLLGNARPTQLGTTICGQPSSLPLILSPIGNLGLVHPAGDLGVARVAAEAGLLMIMSGSASYSVAEVAAAVPGMPWYQVYPWISREFYGRLISDAAAAGCPGLVFTVDSSPLGNRERDVANGFMPSKALLTRSNLVQCMLHPAWTARVVRHRRVVVKAFSRHSGKPPLRSLVSDAARSASQVTRSMLPATWREVEWVRAQWSGPLAIKGLVHPHDALRAVDLGVNAVIVSNHGGRQLDSAPAALEALPPIVAAIGSRAEIILDGGIRRGTDIVKALCLGARAVSVGRPWVYGLAAAGLPGVRGALDILARELATAVNLLGEPNAGALDRSWLRPSGVPFCGAVAPLPSESFASRRPRYTPTGETEHSAHGT